MGGGFANIECTFDAIVSVVGPLCNLNTMWVILLYLVHTSKSGPKIAIG